ncbi:hypothetical protein [Microbacterium sp. LWH3-1.2]
MIRRTDAAPPVAPDAVRRNDGRKSGAEYATPVAIVPSVDPEPVLIGR